jgi:hypothetical protein
VPTHVRRPFGAYLVPAFADGRVAINPQSIDRIDAPPQGPRQAWNLGQLLGLDGRASLLPLVLALALCGAWLGRALRADPSPPPS